MCGERVQRERQAEQQADRPAADLGFDGQFVRRALIEELQEHLPCVGAAVALGERERKRAAGFGDKATEHRELFGRVHEIGDDLKHASVRGFEAHGDAEQFFFGGGERGRRFAVAGAVVQRARGGEAERTRFNRAAGDAAHGGNLFAGGRFAVGATLAHDVHAQRRVRDLGCEVDVVRTGFERAQEFGERLPVPLQAFGQHDPGDVLDTLHEAYQHAVIVRPAGCEANAAVAHHRRGHTVPGGRR